MKKLLVVLFLTMGLSSMSHAWWSYMTYSIVDQADPYDSITMGLVPGVTYQIRWGGGPATGKSSIIRVSDNSEIYSEVHSTFFEDTFTVPTSTTYYWQNVWHSGDESLHMTIWKWVED